MTEQNEKISIKCVIVGDGSVGKTCMLLSYTTDNFPTEYVPTVFDNYTATVKVDTQMITLGLWDTAGQEDYNKLRSLSYPQSDVFIIVFSVIEPSSFENALKKWCPELEESARNVPKLFVGNKIDLREETDSAPNGKPTYISFQTAHKVISEKQYKYMECSALTQEGLKEVFDEAIKIVLKKREKPVIRKRKAACILI